MHGWNTQLNSTESRIAAGATEKLPGWEKLHAKTVVWMDLRKSALKDIVNWQTRRQISKTKVSTPCLDDHHFMKEELESVGELSKVCSQIVLKCLYLARLGRPDILWTANKLARSVTKWTRACDRLARLISSIHHTNNYRQYCHVGNTAQHCRVGLFQESDFAGDFEDSKSTSGQGSYVYLEVERSCPLPGCVRSKRQYPTVLQNQKLFRWMLD